MSPMAAGNAEQLLPRDLSEIYKTGEVLKKEFKLIHGRDAWDPEHLKGDAERAREVKQAKEHLPPSAALPSAATEAETPAAKEQRQRAEDEAKRLAIHAWSVRNLPDSGQAALCLSGGGIRSAAFALGVLQGLARRDLLRQFHYLSTVSGGGYIGSWFTAWRHRDGLDTVLKCLRGREFGEFSEPAPMQRLRFNQNFLTPKVGLLSADTWAVLGALLRNLLLNWLVFLPLLTGLLLAPRIVQALLFLMEDFDPWSSSPVPYSSVKALFAYLWVPHHAGEPIAGIADLGNWRSWIDSVGVALVVLGFGVSAYHRPASGLATMTQTGFVKWVVVPVFAGAILLTAAIASWLRQMSGSPIELARWAYFGALVYVLARLIAAVCAFPRRDQVPAFHKWVFPLELLGWAVAGLCTGLLIGVGVHHWHLQLEPHLAELTDDFTRKMAKNLAVYGPPWIIFSFLFGEVVYVGVTSRLPYGERDREWLGRAAGWFGIFGAGYLAFSWLVLFGWDWIREIRFLVVGIGGAGLLSIAGALAPLTRPAAARTSKEKFPITGIVATLSGLSVLGASALLAQATLNFLSPVHVLVHWGAGFPMIGGELAEWAFEPATELGFIALTCLLLMGVSAAIAWCVNVNFFSLHALYRNRLIKTFLGASNVAANHKAEGRNAFDGFSDQDNLGMAELYGPMEVGKVVLYPVLNMSLNVLATQNLAWQERKAEPFVCTPFFTGGDLVGYRPSILYCAGWWRHQNEPKRGITLGTAMAVSGAAVSPNWGYHSSPITSFLMMLANVRLGWWLGNPKHRATWRYSGPCFSWRLFLQEALGWTDDEEPWVYLSDGGHFEDLGLYEMVRRRCRTIVVSDAGADPKCTLEDLGNAVRKIAIDLGVKIGFRRIHLRRRSDVAMAGVYCAVGEICYPEGKPGRIVYFKPGFYGAEEPADVRAYAAANAKFPHESTINQWFGESQFESYRALGAYVIEEICATEESGDLTLTKFVSLADKRLDEFAQNHVNDGATLVEIRRRKSRAPPERQQVGA